MKAVVKSVFIISLFTLLDRILGFIFKIYLSRQLGAEAIGIYQVAFSIFIMLLTLVTSGLPLIVSKQTAKFRLLKDKKRESSLASAALIINIVISFITCAVILIFYKPLGQIFSFKESRTILFLLLPALVFSSVYSALRGNLWGRQKYFTVSLLELSEQIARIAVCIALFSVGFNKLNSASLSLSIGCLISSIICTICYFVSGARLSNPKGSFKYLMKSSIPVTLARCATSIVGGISAVLIPFLLMASGKSSSEAMYEYGYSAGMALPLIFIPLTIVGALAFVMIPSLSEASEKKDSQSIKRQLEGSIKFSIVLAALFFPFFYALGEPIGIFVYNNIDAGIFLKKAAWLLIPISIESITSSMMNSIDMEIRGLVHYFIGSFIMFSIYFISYKRFSMEIMIAGTAVSWLFSTLLNLLAMRKKVKISFNFLFTLLISCLLCIPSIFLNEWLFNIFYPLNLFLRITLAGVIGFTFILTLNFLFGLLKLEYFSTKKVKHKRLQNNI